MEKQWVKIPEVLFFQEGPGVRNTQYTTEGVKLLNVANLVDGKVDLSTSDRYISKEDAYGKYKHFLCDAGDFIVASSGIKVEYIDKKMGFIDEAMLPLCMNTSTIRFKVLDEKQLKIRYFMYYLKSQHFKSLLSKYITGSAQLNYGPSHLSKMIVPLVSVHEQIGIISILDKVQHIIDVRQQQLQKLDQLVKARFVEMFGAISEVVPLSYYIGGLNAGKSLAGEEENPNKVLKTGAATYDYFDETQIKNLPIDYEPQENHRVKAGDVIISRMNTAELVGAAAYVWDVPEHIYLPDRLWRAEVKETANPIFVWQVLIQSSTKENIRRIASGTSGSMKNISKPGLLGIRVVKAPIDLQEQFAAFVEQTDKSKAAVEKASDEARSLFDCLMQEYFK